MINLCKFLAILVSKIFQSYIISIAKPKEVLKNSTIGDTAMFQRFKKFCVFSTKPSIDDLLCDDNKCGHKNRGVL